MLRPADAVHERRRALAPGVLDEQLADLREDVLRHAAHPFDRLRRVAGVVALEDLPDAARVLQRRIEFWLFARCVVIAALTLARERFDIALLVALPGRGGDERILVLPARRVVSALLLVEPREQPIGADVLELLADDRRRVGVGEHVLAEVRFGAQHVVDHAAEEGDVGAGAQRHEHVGECTRAAVVGIDVDHRRAARLGLHHPLERDGMGLGHVRALEHDQVGVLQVTRQRAGGATAEGRAEADDRRAVADAGLVLDLHDSRRGEELLY